MTKERTSNCSMYLCEAGATYGGTPVTTLTDASNGIAAVVTTNKFTCATTNFFKELAVGMRILAANFDTSGNNGYCTITAISSDYKEITVDKTLSTDAADTAATITPVWWPVSFTAETLKPNMEDGESERITSQRNVAEVFRLFSSLGGDVNDEVSFPLDSSIINGFGRVLEGVFESAFTSVSVTGAGSSDDIKFGDGVGTITGSSSSYWDDFVVGTWARVSGCATTANNGVYLISDITDAVMTVTKPQDSTWAGFTALDSSGATVKSCYMRNGTTPKYFNAEKRYGTIGKYEYMIGLRPTGLKIDIASKSKITATITWSGKAPTPGTSSVSGSDASASTNTIMRAGTNVGYVLDNGTLLSTAVKSINLTIDNGAQQGEDVTHDSPTDLIFGTFRVTGSAVTAFEDLTLYNKAINSTLSSLCVIITDDDGNSMILTVHALKYKGAPNIPGQNQDVPLNLEFTGQLNSTYSCTAQIDLLAA